MKTSLQRVAVIGATGQVGKVLSHALLNLGHEVLAISRGQSAGNGAALQELASRGAEIAFLEDLANVERLSELLSGCDVAAVTLRVNARLVPELEPPILEAARRAKVRRFVPDEFGVHTKALAYGVGTIFDAKKRFHEAVIASGLEWTLIYPGGFFDYFLPNLRFFERITTFGNLDCTFPTHALEDIGAIAAHAITDPRTARKAVQLHANVVTQRELLQKLRQFWPDYPFEFEHVSSEEIIYLKDHADPLKISAKAGAEPDRERHGINYAIYVLGQFAALHDPDTVNAQELYPDYLYRKPEEALIDARFVFGAKPSALL